MLFSTLLSGFFCASVAFAAPSVTVSDLEGYKTPNAKPSHDTCEAVGISQAEKKKVVKQFAANQIVPELVDRINPSVKVDVVYDTINVGRKAVELGTYFTVIETIDAPKLSFTAEKKFDPRSTKYSIFLVDPDVPQDGSLAQVDFLHWIVSHASPSCVEEDGETTMLYEPLTPASVIQHRYTFLVYREPERYEPDDLLLQVKTPFDLNHYTQTKGLTLVGGNFLKEGLVNGIQSGSALPGSVGTEGEYATEGQ